MKKIISSSLVTALLVILSTVPVLAFPKFLNQYKKNERAKKNVSCELCHKNPAGGGPRNAFGQAFEANGKKITNKLIEDFPGKFKPLENNDVEDGGENGEGDNAQDNEPQDIANVVFNVEISDLTEDGGNWTISANADGLGDGESLELEFVTNKKADGLVQFEPKKFTINFDAEGNPEPVQGIMTAGPKVANKKVQKKLDKGKAVKVKKIVLVALDRDGKRLNKEKFKIDLQLVRPDPAE